MADGPALRSKSMGRCNKCPATFGTWTWAPLFALQRNYGIPNF